MSRGRRAQGPRDPFPDHPHALVSTEAWRQGARSSNPAHPPKAYVQNLYSILVVVVVVVAPFPPRERERARKKKEEEKEK